ncbi:MAG TPA: hypothetical protein VGS12_13440 [Caulobacteraceae bacterium]|nr:hypothetical protein [Caulobacteraceae bacterium]
MRLSTTTPDTRRLARRLFDELDIAAERAIGASALEALVAEAARHGARVEAARLAGDRCCAACGCTRFTACLTADGPCSWAAADLCTACAAYPED